MNKRATGAMRPLKYLSAALLALASSSAMALGLGDIRVLSRPGQPLLAEIPVITADPSELQNLRVGLASPVTFERVGLQRPGGLVGELQFELTRNAQGRAVVRVTSQAPVETPSLSFLVEADWGQGRLVREYSALIDAPSSAVAVAEPEIVAPAGALSNTIVRELPEPAVPPAAPRAQAGAQRGGSASAAAPSNRAQGADGTVTVQAGQTLSHIAQGVARGQQVSRDRAMIALLRANPEAFIRGNVNLLRQGAVLRLPDAGTLAAVDGEEAAAMVREHAAQWRQSRTLPQPAAVADTPAAAPAVQAPPSSAQGARLEIAPAAAASAASAGTTTGTGDGDEGDMLANEQLRQAREDLATRDAEVDELKQRVAELEKLQQQQQALVALKDTELAAAQDRLAQGNNARADVVGPWYWLGVPVLLLAAAGWWLARRRRPSPLPPLVRDEADGNALHASVAAGAGLDAVVERDAWQRQELGFGEAATVTDPPPEATVQDLGELPADVKSEAPAADVRAALPAWPEHDPISPPFEREAAEPLQHADPLSDDAQQTGPAALPAVEPPPHDPVPDYARQAEQQPGFRGVFDYPASGAEMTLGSEEDLLQTPASATADLAPQADNAARLGTQDEGVAAAADAQGGQPGALRSGGHDRLELAIAYLDLGDAQTARTLLLDVAQADEPQLAAQARELLARLG